MFTKVSENSALSINSLVLAYVGDGVFSLYVRNYLAISSDCKAGTLHVRSNYYVKATSQSKMYDVLLPHLTEQETSVLKRARNCHSNNKAKNAGIIDYKKATAVEGLIGYLFLTDKMERLGEIIDICMNFDAVISLPVEENV